MPEPLLRPAVHLATLTHTRQPNISSSPVLLEITAPVLKTGGDGRLEKLPLTSKQGGQTLLLSEAASTTL